MPRKKRIWYPDATYHVMSPGNRRLSIFKEREDYYEFLDCLARTKEKYDHTILTTSLAGIGSSPPGRTRCA